MYTRHAAALRFNGEVDWSWSLVMSTLREWLVGLGCPEGECLISDGSHQVRDVSAAWLVGGGALEVEVEVGAPSDYIQTVVHVMRERRKVRVVVVERCRVTGGDLRPIESSPPPYVLVELLNGARAVDGDIQVQAVSQVIDAEAVGDLVAELCDRARRLPIVVVSDLHGESFVDAGALARSLAGQAHVRRLQGGAASRELSARVGDHRSTYGGAMRIYWPGFHEHCPQHEHRYVTGEALRSASDRIVAALRAELTSMVAARLPSQGPVRRQRGTSAPHAAEVAPGEASAEWLRWADGLLTRLASTQAELEETRDALDDAEATIAQLSSAQETVPTMLAAVEQAVDAGGPEVVYLREAFDSATASPYRRPERARAALFALNDAAKRLATDALDGGFVTFFNQAGIRYASDVSATARGKWPHEYRRTWRGREIWLGPHLKLGSGSPENHCRIYFHVDHESRRIVIGHVGRHLTDTMTG